MVSSFLRNSAINEKNFQLPWKIEFSCSCTVAAIPRKKSRFIVWKFDFFVVLNHFFLWIQCFRLTKAHVFKANIFTFYRTSYQKKTRHCTNNLRERICMEKIRGFDVCRWFFYGSFLAYEMFLKWWRGREGTDNTVCHQVDMIWKSFGFHDEP